MFFVIIHFLISPASTDFDKIWYRMFVLLVYMVLLLTVYIAKVSFL